MPEAPGCTVERLKPKILSLLSFNARGSSNNINRLGFNVLSPLTPTQFPDSNQHRPDILDIALLKRLALRLGGIETLQRFNSDHCPVHLNPITFDDRDKAECLADSIKQQCSQTSSPYDPQHTHRIEEEVQQTISLDSEDDLDPVSLDEVQSHIKKLNTRKAPQHQ
ncbi:hypothetical protein EVAR_93219_1 [Eumeta japonica]|uniref:Uncharacterized protein n=1 Tax=Eumeta variegata TaxID=151549 RepID=A0A4C1TXK5_EUMVA|nr:hypothetical protein EVAR_93219_1 [Eumeta japonica]